MRLGKVELNPFLRCALPSTFHPPLHADNSRCRSPGNRARSGSLRLNLFGRSEARKSVIPESPDAVTPSSSAMGEPVERRRRGSIPLDDTPMLVRALALDLGDATLTVWMVSRAKNEQGPPLDGSLLPLSLVLLSPVAS